MPKDALLQDPQDLVGYSRLQTCIRILQDEYLVSALVKHAQHQARRKSRSSELQWPKQLKLGQEMPSSETERRTGPVSSLHFPASKSPGFPDPAGTDQGNWALGSNQVKTAPFDPPNLKWSRVRSKMWSR